MMEHVGEEHEVGPFNPGGKGGPTVDMKGYVRKSSAAGGCLVQAFRGQVKTGNPSRWEGATEQLGQETYPAADIKDVSRWKRTTESPDSLELIPNEVLDSLAGQLYAPGEERLILPGVGIKGLTGTAMFWPLDHDLRERRSMLGRLSPDAP